VSTWISFQVLGVRKLEKDVDALLPVETQNDDRRIVDEKRFIAYDGWERDNLVFNEKAGQ